MAISEQTGQITRKKLKKLKSGGSGVREKKEEGQRVGKNWGIADLHTRVSSLDPSELRFQLFPISKWSEPAADGHSRQKTGTKAEKVQVLLELFQLTQKS